MFEKANGLAWRVERTGGLPQQSWEAISLLRYNVAAASDGVEAERGPAIRVPSQCFDEGRVV